MPNQLINTYYNALHKFKQFGGSHNETSLEHAFISLVNSYAEKHHLLLVPKISVEGKKGNKIIPDGVLKNALRLEFGYWESKDSYDDLDREIHKKLYEDGYPDRNILFEDTKTAVLIQEGAEVMRVSMEDAARLDEILNHFIGFEPLQVREFNKALEQFKKDVPEIVKNLRELIEQQAETNQRFVERRNHFHELAKGEINPEITPEDIREMLIQHILTEDIFNNVFGNAAFHRFNNIARELEGVLDTFMDYGVRQNHLQSIKSYYEAIRNASSQLADHHEKQKFLKNIYENFYKVYNPKGADRLGVVYTPNEIVRFMIESTDYLLEKHFGKTLGSNGVEILDPATGTGTFVAELIEYINPHDLKYKYANEIHANEVAILPYYIANLNIEYTYQQKMNDYATFNNICFVDTLDNTSALAYSGKQEFLFALSSENADRIKRQNEKKISVIIGNPPYNAKQENYNYQNSNRAYKEIDKRIKDTYIRYGTAQNQIVVYDMFTRFYRWSSDRVDKNGVIAFVTNRTFIDSRAFDGFRKEVSEEFDSIYVVDLRSDVRANPKIAGTTHNVFGIQTGVAIAFLVKDAEKHNSKRKCQIHYIELDDFWRKEKKLEWLGENPLKSIHFENIEPDAKHNWINQTNNDWDSLMPLIDKDVKAGKSDKAIFKLFSSGLKTQRDEWVYDFSKDSLEEKMRYFVEIYEATRKDEHFADKMKIKWDDDLETYLMRNIKKQFDEKQIITSNYRPYSKRFFYFDKHFNGRTYQWKNIYKEKGQQIIGIPSVGSPKDFHSLALDKIMDLNSLPAGGQYLPLYTFDSENHKHDNITDWALSQFRERYASESVASVLADASQDNLSPTLDASAHADATDKTPNITKSDIFYYVYAVLHCPLYRQKYEQNLKREFPRIPFYEDFNQWRDWGAELMDLHINYETQEPFALERKDADLTPKKKNKQDNLFTEAEETETETFISAPRTKLRADKTQGVIEIDSHTQLTGIPPRAWEYKLGNRSALEWILDQYKESKPKDATIAEKFNTYKFADYKEQVIELLKKVCTVSVKTTEIIEKMPKG